MAGHRDVQRFAFSSMGCPCELQLEAEPGLAARAAEAARAEVERLDRKYSHFRDDSFVAWIGRSSDAGEYVDVDAETADLIDFAAALHAQSGGRFDITAGPLTKAWDLQGERLPDRESLDAARARSGWHHVEWRRPWLRLDRPGMRLDLGGVVKEYAADRAAQACRAAGVRHGVVDHGGDLAVVGAHADGSAWIAGIKMPADTARALARIELHGGGLATSGDYERALVVDGRRYSHIVDPRSGIPVESFSSVSVVADNCLVAGAASTVAMLLGIESGYDWLSGLGLPFLCVTADGAMRGTLQDRRA
jgi:thiamine biosynthesis lipoprotein